MAREKFYEMTESAYLFPEALKKGDARDCPEEAVRQWCAYELIRAYGIRVTELEFEYPVKVGSKNYRIDILASRHGSPAVVVECKPRNFTKHAEAMAQAISYADAQNVRADFAVYTNGDAWHVKRRFHGEWVPVPDLPREIDQKGTEPVAELLRAFSDVKPLLCKLGEPLRGEDAWYFLSAMQKFFCGSNLLTEDINQDLRFACDNLLRSLWAAGDDHYRTGKFQTAQTYFEKYRKEAALGFDLAPGGDTLWIEIHHLHAGLMSIVDGTKGFSSGDLLVLRLATALLNYGRRLSDVKKPKLYPLLEQGIHDALHAYLGYALTLHLNVSLPDPLDNIWVGDIRGYCLPAWKAHVEEG